jgi:hypothetical protein
MNYFPKGNSMNWVHVPVNWVHRHGPQGRGVPGHYESLVYGSTAEILWIEGVRGDLISTVYPRAGSRYNTHGGTKGGSPELSLALASVAHSPLGLHLRDL